MTEMKKVLVTGSNGLLGQAIVRKFNDNFYLVGCDLANESYNTTHPLKEYHQLDLTQRDKITNFFAQFKPDIIINTAAYTDVDKSEEERDLCWAGNVRSVEFMIETVSDFTPIFVQISTDYVFDGKTGHYKENDETNPVSYYGHTKLAAEKIIRGSGLEYIIARSMVLYGKGEKVRNNFVTWVIEQLENKKKIKVVNDQRGNPTLVDDLSEAIYRLIEQKDYGIFHIAGNENLSRFEFAQHISKVFGLESSFIEEVSSDTFKQQAPRPVNSSFNLNKLSNTLDWLPGGVIESLSKLKSMWDKD